MATETVRGCPTVKELPPGWHLRQLRSFCTKIGTGATPRGGSEVYLTSRIRHALIRSQNVFDRYFDGQGLAYISEDHAKELRNAEVQHRDILLNITGDGATFGRSCIVPDSVLPACVNQHVSIIRPDPKVCDPGYLLSVLTHPAVKPYIESFNSGGSRRAITKAHIESFGIPLPPLAEQRAIAYILGTLDNKIHLNRHTNTTLEAIAQALFKHWFVDPTQDGLPNGWRDGTLADLFSPVRNRIGGRAAVVLSAISSSQLIRSDEHFTKQVYSKSIENYLAVELYDFAYNPSRINIGSIGLLKQDVFGAVSPVYEVFRPKSGFHWFLERFIALPDTRRRIQALCSGSVRQSLKLADLGTIPCVAPTVTLVKAFNSRWEQLYAMITINDAQSRTLAELRGALLPKLLSGELRIEDAEQFLEART